MMIMLRDDHVIEVFESPQRPPNWIEAIDIENHEYRFCDDRGQRYSGVITKPAGWFKQGTFQLQPDGQPDLEFAVELVDNAVDIEPNERFRDLPSLRRHLLGSCPSS